MPVDFPILAQDAKSAAAIVKKMGRVKKDHKDPIIDVRKVSKREYLEQHKINNKDPYLCTKTSHDQDKIMDQLRDRLIEDPHYSPKKNK